MNSADLGRPSEAILRIPVNVQVVIGSTTMPVANLMKLGRGAIVALDQRVGDPVDVVVNGRVVARGEVVVVEEDGSRFGVSLSEIVGGGVGERTSQRKKKLSRRCELLPERGWVLPCIVLISDGPPVPVVTRRDSDCVTPVLAANPHSGAIVESGVLDASDTPPTRDDAGRRQVLRALSD